MEPVEFPASNIIFGSKQPQYNPLPGYRVPDDPAGTVVFCWKLTPEELAEVIRTGVIWQQVLTFDDKLQPQQLTATQPATIPAE